MDLFLKLLIFLTYTNAPTEEGKFEPSLLLHVIGGWNDIEQIDDRDVLPPVRNEQKPCPALEKLRMAEAASPEDEGKDFDRLRRMHGDREEWDPEFVRGMLERYERCFELLDELMVEPEIRCEIPPFGQPGSYDVYTLMRFANPLQLRTRMHREAGSWASAVESLRDQNRYANFLIKSPGPLINLLVGLALEKTFLASAERLINEPNLPADQIAEVRMILADGPRREAVLIRTWKHEYNYQKRMAQDLANGLTFEPFDLWAQMTGEEPGPFDQIRFAVHRCSQQLILAVGYQPNRAIRLSATMVEQAIVRTGLSFAERANAEIQPAFLEDRHWSSYLHSNGVAEYMMRRSFEPGLKALDRVDYIEAYRQGLLAVLGIRGFHEANKRLPDSLDALAPAFLAAVPSDPYDGRLVKYSAKHRRVWVVGKDLSDDGGMEEREVHRGFRDNRPIQLEDDEGYDPTLFLKWMAPVEDEKR